MATTQTPNTPTTRAPNAKPQASGGAPPKASAKPASATTPKAIAPGDAAQEATLGQRMMRLLRGSKVNTAAPTTGGAKATANATPDAAGRRGALGTPPGYWRKFFQGSLIFVGGSYIIILGLTYLALHYPSLGLGAYIQPPKANVFVLSGLTWENLIFFVVIIGLWLLVQRLGLMPRPEPMTPNSARGVNATGNGAAKSGAKGTPQLPGIGEHRTRAERRRLADAAAEKEAQKAAVRAKGKGGATATVAAPAKNGRVATGKTPLAAAVASNDMSGEHDEVYERVKAEQRLRRRREGKR